MNRDEAEAIAERHAVKQDGGLYSEVLSVYGAGVAILEAVAIERQRCADLCRTLQRESRTRIELGYVCARAILGEEN